MIGQVMRAMICMSRGRNSFGYPGNTAHAMWSTVIAAIAMSFMALELSGFFSARGIGFPPAGDVISVSPASGAVKRRHDLPQGCFWGVRLTERHF